MPGVFFSSTSHRRSSPKPSSLSLSPAVHRAAVDARADYIACIFVDVAARACTRVRPPLPVPACTRVRPPLLVPASARLCPLPPDRHRPLHRCFDHRRPRLLGSSRQRHGALEFFILSLWFDPVLPLFYTILRIVLRFNASRRVFLTTNTSSACSKAVLKRPDSDTSSQIQSWLDCVPGSQLSGLTRHLLLTRIQPLLTLFYLCFHIIPSGWRVGVQLGSGRPG
ncbi:hypothetical protein ACLOJK_011561 [Asimina triloba]